MDKQRDQTSKREHKQLESGTILTVLIGFALETNNGENEALKKLKNKKIDYIVLNYANEEGAGFETNTNHVYLYSKSGEKKELKLDRKDRIAQNIIKWVL